MTNAELIQKIRAEIERLKKEELTRNSIGVITGSAFFVSANELLSFLSTLESEIPTNLDEAAWRYVKNKYGIYDPQKVFENEEIAEDFKAGYNLCKEQMLKVAVEGTVMDFSSNQPRPQVDVYVDPNKYCTGDKVRIIIVKE